MSIAVKFDKERALYLLDCLSNGKPIAASSEGWTGNDMLALAGACLFSAQSQGPESFWLKEIPESLHLEHQELVEESFENDIHAAIGFYGHLTLCVQDGKYDDKFAPQSCALVSQTGEVRLEVVPVKGFKGRDDLV